MVLHKRKVYGKFVSFFLKTKGVSIIHAIRGWTIRIVCFVIARYIPWNIARGEYQYIESNGKMIKECSGCTFPHKAENYDVIIEFLSK